MGIYNDGYIGIARGLYSQEYKDVSALEFLSKESNLWIGAWLFSFYPEDMTADVLFLVTQSDFTSRTNIFMKSLFYGDSFSLVYSPYGILDNCTIIDFEMTSVKSLFLSVRAKIKVGNFIPNNSQEENLESILDKKVNTSEIEKKMNESFIDIKDCKITNVCLHGLGDMTDQKKKIVLIPYGNNKYSKQAILNIYFELSSHGMEDNISKTIMMLKNGVYFNEYSVIREYMGWSTSKVVDIPQKNFVRLQCGEMFSFMLKNPVLHDLTYVVRHAEKKENVQTLPAERSKQESGIYCLKIRGNIEYSLIKPKLSLRNKKIM